MKGKAKIKRIKCLKKFGLFADYSHDAKNTDDFARFNLFYGWNGSGKSTLARMFRHLEGQRKITHGSKDSQDEGPSGEFPGARFAIEASSEASSSASQIETSITSKSLSAEDIEALNVHTFNQEFIDKNIDWNTKITSLLLLGEQNRDFEGLKKLQGELSTLKSKIPSAQGILDLEDRISSEKTEIAKKIKEKLVHFDASSTFTAKRLDSPLKDYDTTACPLERPDNSEGERLKAAANPEQEILKEIELNPRTLKAEEDSLEAMGDILNKLLQESPAAGEAQLRQLLGDERFSPWVEEGINLHQMDTSNPLTKCGFCTNSIPGERKVKLLEFYRADSRKDLKERLEAAQRVIGEKCEHLKRQQEGLPETKDFYPEIETKAEIACGEAEEKINARMKRYKSWISVLDRKIKSPDQAHSQIKPMAGESAEEFNQRADSLGAVIEENNQKTKDFHGTMQRAKKKLGEIVGKYQDYLVDNEIRASALLGKIKDLFSRRQLQKKLESEIREKDEEIQRFTDRIYQETADAVAGVDALNKKLHVFLGHKELTLEYKTEGTGKGYLLFRTDPTNREKKRVRWSLSESERTAIAFIYFITSLGRKKNSTEVNKIEDSIVVIDDPVSSFDSTRLFYASSFLMSHCLMAKQLFVLTHNFTFFLLLRKALSGDKPKFYLVEETFKRIEGDDFQSIRGASLKNAGEVLKNFNSEYHYLFHKLYQLKLSRKSFTPSGDSFLAANLARKILETILFFKIPDEPTKRLYGRLNLALGREEFQEDESLRQIVNFVNKYSHHDRVETDSDPDANQLGEGYEIVPKVFDLIKSLDKEHFEGMLFLVHQTRPLMALIKKKKADAKEVRRLIAAGANVNAPDKDGNTPLIEAARRGHLSVVECLIEAESDTKGTDRDGKTALIEAAANGNLKVVYRLLEAGADKDARDANNRTACMLAKQYDHNEVVIALTSLNLLTDSP